MKREFREVRLIDEETGWWSGRRDSRYGLLRAPSDRFNLHVTATYKLFVDVFRFYVQCATRLASLTTTLSLRTASSVSSSLSMLKLARTYAVLRPLEKNTVPGSARTPAANALVSIKLLESPPPMSLEAVWTSPSELEGMSNLNL